MKSLFMSNEEKLWQMYFKLQKEHEEALYKLKNAKESSEIKSDVSQKYEEQIKKLQDNYQQLHQAYEEKDAALNSLLQISMINDKQSPPPAKVDEQKRQHDSDTILQQQQMIDMLKLENQQLQTKIRESETKTSESQVSKLEKLRQLRKSRQYNENIDMNNFTQKAAPNMVSPKKSDKIPKILTKSRIQYIQHIPSPAETSEKDEQLQQELRNTIFTIFEFQDSLINGNTRISDNLAKTCKNLTKSSSNIQKVFKLAQIALIQKHDTEIKKAMEINSSESTDLIETQSPPLQTSVLHDNSPPLQTENEIIQMPQQAQIQSPQQSPMQQYKPQIIESKQASQNIILRQILQESNHKVNDAVKQTKNQVKSQFEKNKEKLQQQQAEKLRQKYHPNAQSIEPTQKPTQYISTKQQKPSNSASAKQQDSPTKSQKSPEKSIPVVVPKNLSDQNQVFNDDIKTLITQQKQSPTIKKKDDLPKLSDNEDSNDSLSSIFEKQPQEEVIHNEMTELNIVTQKKVEAKQNSNGKQQKPKTIDSQMAENTQDEQQSSIFEDVSVIHSKMFKQVLVLKKDNQDDQSNDVDVKQLNAIKSSQKQRNTAEIQTQTQEDYDNEQLKENDSFELVTGSLIKIEKQQLNKDLQMLHDTEILNSQQSFPLYDAKRQIDALSSVSSKLDELKNVEDKNENKANEIDLNCQKQESEQKSIEQDAKQPENEDNQNVDVIEEDEIQKSETHEEDIKEQNQTEEQDQHSQNVDVVENQSDKQEEKEKTPERENNNLDFLFTPEPKQVAKQQMDNVYQEDNIINVEEDISDVVPTGNQLIQNEIDLYQQHADSPRINSQQDDVQMLQETSKSEISQAHKQVDEFGNTQIENSLGNSTKNINIPKKQVDQFGNSILTSDKNGQLQDRIVDQFDNTDVNSKAQHQEHRLKDEFNNSVFSQSNVEQKLVDQFGNTILSNQDNTNRQIQNSQFLSPTKKVYDQFGNSLISESEVSKQIERQLNKDDKTNAIQYELKEPSDPEDFSKTVLKQNRNTIDLDDNVKFF